MSDDQHKIVPRLSVGLQHKIYKTTHTRSASGGYHWLFEISRQDFPKGVTQGTYWTSIHNGHAEIKVLGTNQYLIERGDGYEPIRGIESIVILLQQEVNELLRTLDKFDKETKAVRKIGSKLVQYWTQPKRHDVALYTAGFLYKNGVPKNLACELMEHIIGIADLPDDNLQRTLSRVEDTYAMDLNSEPVGGYTKLLEVVNDDESVISIIQKEFGKLGYHFSGNGNGKGTKQKEKSEFEAKKDKNRYEYIQKYSISETVLAEAIIIGQKAFFAVADFTDPNEVKITLEKQIELDDDRKTVLKPLDLISYINKPYQFKSEEEFWGNVEKAKQETTDSLYTKVKAIWKKYVDADNFHISICSTDTIFTHKQDRAGTCHYLFFVGDNDSGKSANLTILEYLAYRNMSSIGITYANIYQFLGSRDEGAGTICEDEADNIDQDADKMRLYKSGYTKGKVVPKTDTSYGRTQYKFNAYCFKAFAAEKLPDPLIAKGFLQRTIELKCVPGFPDHDISEVVDPGDDEELQGLLDELMELRNVLFCHFRLLHYKDRIPNIKLNIRNREKQLFKPVLRVFHGTKTFNELLPVISKYVSQKREAKVDSYHAFLFGLIRDMIVEQKNAILESKDIWEKFKEKVDWKPIPNRPQSIDTVEFGVKSQKELCQTLKDVFGAKPPKRHDKGRGLVFDLDFLDKISRAYDIDVEIKVKEGDVQDRTLRTLRTLVGLDRHLTDPPSVEDIAESAEEDNRNNRESVTNLNESETDRGEDQATHSSNVSDVSDVSDSPNHETTGLDPPDPARTSQFLKNLQEAERTRKSKVAD